MKKSICVYCGSNAGQNPVYAEAARAVGTHLGENGHTLVYGGGRVGLMGLVADAAIEAGGHVVGIIPDFLHEREVAHSGVQDLKIVSSMHERKQLMADASDAFVALPGGIGTMEEFFEAVTWRQLDYHAKPIALLNVDGFYDGIEQFFDTMISTGFLRPKHSELFFSEIDPNRLLDRLGCAGAEK